MWILKFIKNFLKRERDEQGSGLMTVLGVSLVVTIAAGTITSSLIMASNLTADNLSEQQAKEASAAGLSDALSKYTSKKCEKTVDTNVETNTTSPKYTYFFYRSTADTLPDNPEASSSFSWGCPGGEFDNGTGTGSKADRWVKIKSIGYGKNGATNEETAVYKVQPENMSIIPQAVTGNLIALADGSVIKKSQGVTGSNPSAYVSDSFICGVVNTRDENNYTKSNILNGDLKYNSKNNFSYEGSYQTPCTINGNIDAKEDTTNTSFKIGSTEVNGNICANKSISRTNAPKSSGRLYKGSTSNPCNTQGVFYNYTPDMSENSTVKLAASQCTNWNNFRNAIISQTADHTFIDATLCDYKDLKTILSTPSLNKTLPLKGNATLVFNNYLEIDNLKVSVDSTVKKELFFNIVIPSDNPNSGTASPSGPKNTSSIYALSANNIQYLSGTSGNIYSAHGMVMISGKSNVNGQAYSDAIVYVVDSTLNYMPVGLPDAEKKLTKDIGRAQDLIRVY